jgi:lipopolysaccharide transport system ATP-binding protein
MPVIRIQGLGKTYRAFSSPWQRLKELALPKTRAHSREFRALEDISLEIERGCALGVVGPNGAGKSTLLKILAGIIEPSEGNVQVQGTVASIIELGAGFHPDFTGRENVHLNAAVLGYTPDHAKAVYEEIARFSELGHYMDMPVKTYSSGMFVRLAFAVAISSQPDVLLVDEALAVGDAVFAHRCLNRIREMRERGVTIVYVSHDTNTVAGVCDRAIFLDRGRLVADGPPKDVIHLYLLNVAERLTTLRERGDIAAAFHEVGAVEMTSEANEKRFGSFQARITDIHLEDETGRAIEKIVSGGPLRVRMIVRFDCDITDPVFGVMVKNRFGVEMFGTNTNLQRISTGTYGDGTAAEVVFDFPMQLGTGVYTVSCAVHTAGGHFFDYRVDARILEVLGPLETIGVVNLPTRIAFRPVSTDSASHDTVLQKAYGHAPSELLMGDDAEQFLQGAWYAPQTSADGTYRWLGGQGRAFVTVPPGCKTVSLKLRTYCPDIAEKPMRVECRIDEGQPASIVLHDSEWQIVQIPAVRSESRNLVRIQIVPDRTWIPREYDSSSTDTRELSVQVAEIRADR